MALFPMSKAGEGIVSKATFVNNYTGTSGTISGLTSGKSYGITFFDGSGKTESITNGTETQSVTISNAACGMIAFTAQGTSVTYTGSNTLSGTALYILS